MIDYMKETFANLMDKVKTMPISSLRTRFKIGVVCAVIYTIAIMIFLIIQGLSVSPQTIFQVLILLLSGVIGWFVYAIDWKLIFFPFLAVYHGNWILFLPNLMISMMCWGVFIFVVGIKGIIRLAANKEQ